MSNPSRLRGVALELGGFAVHVARRFQDDGCFAAAGALSYTTLVSLVPLLVIALAVLSAFPIFESLRDRILGVVFTNFVPEVGSNVVFYISEFTASAGKTTAVGLVVFAATGVLLLATIEDRLNAIWRVHAPRRWITRLLVYWTVTTLGPFLLAATLSLSGELLVVRQKVGLTGEISSGMDSLLRDLALLIPFGAEVIGLVTLFSLIPHCPVRWRDALGGAVVAAVLLEISKFVFTFYIGHFASYQAIYGALAAIPIFLLWMYLGWSIILFGAEIAASAPHWQTERDEKVPKATDLDLAISLIDVLARQRHRGGQVSVGFLITQVDAPAGVVADCLSRLAQAGWVVSGIGGGWVLARDLADVTLADLSAAIRRDAGRDEDHPRSSPWRRRLHPRFAEVRHAEAAALAVPVSVVLETRHESEGGVTPTTSAVPNSDAAVTTR